MSNHKLRENYTSLLLLKTKKKITKKKSPILTRVLTPFFSFFFYKNTKVTKALTRGTMIILSIGHQKQLSDALQRDLDTLWIPQGVIL